MMDFYDEYSHFRRLHPLTLIYGLIRNLPYLAITFYFAFFQNQTEELISTLIFTLIGMIIIPGFILKWYYYSFMISEHEIIIKSGVISRKQRNIPIERVQNVNVKQDIIQRILGIARVSIETAGDISAEGILEFVKLKDADEINRIIRKYQTKIQNSTDTPDENIRKVVSETYNPTENGEVIFEMTKRDLLVYGMIRLRPLFLIYGLWAMSYITQFKILEKFFMGYLDETINSMVDLPLYYLIPTIIGFLVFSIIISWFIDIIWTFAQFYGFRLIKDGQKLLTSYGLFSKYSLTIPLKKLQQLTISTNPLKKKFDFYTMVLKTAGYDISMKTVPSAVPLAKRKVLEHIAAQIYPVEVPTEFSRISQKSIRRAFVRYLLLSIPLFISLSVFFNYYAVVGLVIVPVLYYGAFLRWQYRGYYISETIVFVKQGFWNQKINIIPIEKIQTLHTTESFFQRQLDLATVHIDTAATSNFDDASIPDIDSQTAVEIMQELNKAFRESNKVKRI